VVPTVPGVPPETGRTHRHPLNLWPPDHRFRHFMLDGQTVVVEDYLAAPERERESRHVRSRLLIGPWYVLPDNSGGPGSVIAACWRAGALPPASGATCDWVTCGPFGHISQLPQILRGFDIETCVQRRLDQQPCNSGVAPDDCDVLTRGGSATPQNGGGRPPRFARGVRGCAPAHTRRTPGADAGTDHMPPRARRAVAYARPPAGDRLDARRCRLVAGVRRALGPRAAP
jgi:hypothetical protein